MKPLPDKYRFIRSRGYFIVIALVILIMNLLFLHRENARIRSTHEGLSVSVANTLFESIVTTREWNALHKGVYVPVTEHIQPNPYLNDPLRDVTTTDGLQLTKINPAYMTRLISELMEDKSTMSYKITSLQPLNPGNAPDAWEQRAMQLFEQGQTSQHIYEDNAEGQTYLRYMEPLMTEESCLTCHGEQGYAVGDVQGGISVTLPFEPFNANIAAITQNNILAYGSMSMLMVAFIFIIALMYEKKEKQLISMSEQAIEASEAKGRFLSSMNHEIRTPLNGIAGYLELLQNTDLTDQQNEYLHNMHHSTQHLLGIVNNVLDMSKIEANEMTIEKEHFHLDEEIRVAFAPLQPLAHRKGLQLQLHFGDHLPEHLQGDNGRLRQIILNLVGNAVKFTEAGTVILFVETMGLQDDHHLLRMTVKDTGPGMTKETLDQLFQPFYQGKDQHIIHPGGTGLGLSITKELVERMGGTIKVESQLGKGTSVEVMLPFQISIFDKESYDSNETKETKSTSTIPRQKILLVEDQELNQRLMKEILKNHGLYCDLAVNGLEAVEACRQGGYDLVLMDVQMPVMDGLEATRQIRALSEMRQPKIAAMTAFATKKDEEKCMAAGMDVYLTKPLDFNQLIALIQAETEKDDDQPLEKVLVSQGLERLMEEMGFDENAATILMKEAVTDWKALIPETIQALDEEGDVVGRNLHKLKGSFANMRLSDLSKRAAEAETLSKAGKTDLLRAKLTEMKTQVDNLL